MLISQKLHLTVILWSGRGSVKLGKVVTKVGLIEKEEKRNTKNYLYIN